MFNVAFGIHVACFMWSFGVRHIEHGRQPMAHSTNAEDTLNAFIFLFLHNQAAKKVRYKCQHQVDFGAKNAIYVKAINRHRRSM